tara:strand:+ start:248 stop:610 length:363 start_codon:yes stop_codon:yes gene_type:complete
MEKEFTFFKDLWNEAFTFLIFDTPFPFGVLLLFTISIIFAEIWNYFVRDNSIMADQWIDFRNNYYEYKSGNNYLSIIKNFLGFIVVYIIYGLFTSTFLGLISAFFVYIADFLGNVLNLIS